MLSSFSSGPACPAKESPARRPGFAAKFAHVFAGKGDDRGKLNIIRVLALLRKMGAHPSEAKQSVENSTKQ
jgi:hypothetical protein